jgi:hypothetical protein
LELFAEANAIPLADTRLNGYLSRLAETLLPLAPLKELERLLPAPRLSLGRWMGGGANGRSLIVALGYHDRTYCRRRKTTVVVSYAKYLKGIVVSGETSESHPLPRYVDELRAKLEVIVGDFVSECAH